MPSKTDQNRCGMYTQEKMNLVLVLMAKASFVRLEEDIQYTMLVFLYDKWMVTKSEKTMCPTIHFQLTNPSGRSVRWSVGRSVGRFYI